MRWTKTTINSLPETQNWATYNSDSGFWGLFRARNEEKKRSSGLSLRQEFEWAKKSQDFFVELSAVNKKPTQQVAWIAKLGELQPEIVVFEPFSRKKQGNREIWMEGFPSDSDLAIENFSGLHRWSPRQISIARSESHPDPSIQVKLHFRVVAKSAKNQFLDPKKPLSRVVTRPVLRFKRVDYGFCSSH